MSAAFDEGGAKGLLLVNLGIGDSCNIVFESMEDDDVDESLVVGVSGDNIDIHSLRQKLEAQLEDEELFELPLVPQLSSLRAEHDSLVEAGFCEAAVMNTVGPKTPGRRRYKASSDDEAMADRSIHESVRGRLGFSMADEEESEMQQGTPSQGDVSIGRHSTSVVNFATDNEYGGDYDDHDDDVVFDNFMANPRFSEEPEQRNDATHLLDAIASGRAQLSTDAFTYFPDKNQWAGSDHWKKKNKTIKKKSTKTKPTKPKKPKSTLVDLGAAPDVSKYLKSSKTSTTWTKTTVKKNTEEDHVLPIDSNINVEHLTKLFLRPDYTPTVQNKESTDEGDKRVSFGLPIVYDDGSFGGGDGDGPGFDLAEPDGSTGDDDFFINDLEGIRKVQRIKVGYASVAKKVDVKKLKHELWSELETRIGYGKGTGTDEGMVEELGEAATELDDATPFSFQEVLKQLESQQSQPDVTFSFYFICALHLANEKGLIFESQGLDDFTIAVDHDVIAE
jgi:condensin complex subunit 2